MAKKRVMKHYRRSITIHYFHFLQLSTENMVFNDTHSRLRYMPEEETDFGLVYCWARNTMGVMRSPCIFQLIPAGNIY